MSPKAILLPNFPNTPTSLFTWRFRVFVVFSFYSLFSYSSAQAAGQVTDLFKDLHSGVHIYKYNWDIEQCVLYVAEMDRRAANLHFEVAIAGRRILGPKSVRSIAHRRTKRGDRRMLVAHQGWLRRFG